MRQWVRETAGWLGALAIALVVAGQAASTPRSELLFRDGDSLIVALVSRSLLDGGPQDWAMSSVLFLPEIAVFTALDALSRLSVDELLAANAVVNLVAVYGGLRLAAGRRREGRSPVAWALCALSLFALLAATETSASRDALEPASLTLTTTYYSATVVAVLLVVGVLRRALEDERRRIALLVTLGLVAAVSTLSNPLFAVWATVPLTVVLVIVAFLMSPPRRMPAPLAGLVGGTALGLLARIPFSAWIANSGAGYAQPELWPQSLAYYGQLLAARLSTPLGIIGTAITVGLLLFAVWRSARPAEPGPRFVTLAAWVVPVLVVIGAIAMGTHAARYLQPLAFAPLLALVAVPRAVRVPPRAGLAIPAAAAVLLLTASALSIPRLQAAATRPDADLACVIDWVDASGRTGAGQFWTVRLPKLHLDDPARLVQVDHELRGYAWLVNRADFRAGEVSFLVEDAQTVRWHLPGGAEPVDRITCGRYTILDFDDAALPLGPLRS